MTQTAHNQFQISLLESLNQQLRSLAAKQAPPQRACSISKMFAQQMISLVIVAGSSLLRLLA